jgi:hypothetical protein
MHPGRPGFGAVAHLLIRAHQESHQNRFPDLERAAEAIGKKRFPLMVDDLIAMARSLGLGVRWFDHAAFREKSDSKRPLDTLVRSFYEAPNTVYLNRQLEVRPGRLKYDIANHIAHRVLHDGDGARTPQIAGGGVPGRRQDIESPNVDAKDILYAWRDFECSYFAAALLGPKTPFRQFLTRHAYAIDIGSKVDLSTTLIMRRMCSVSPYRHWHYFDAYPPGKPRAVWRSRGHEELRGQMMLASFAAPSATAWAAPPPGSAPKSTRSATAWPHHRCRSAEAAPANDLCGTTVQESCVTGSAREVAGRRNRRVVLRRR